MIIKILIGLGLSVIPFFNLTGYDTRSPKMGLAVAFALILGLLGLYHGELKLFKNKWLFIFLGFMLISWYLAPKFYIPCLGNSIDLARFWTWKPMFNIFVFSLMLITISSTMFFRKDILMIFNVMVWVGFLMSIYVLAQYFNVDQFFVDIAEAGDWHLINNNRMGGTLGNAAVVSSFLAMIIPIALFLKQRFKAVVMGVAIYITHSQIAIGAVIISLLFLFATKGWRCLILSCLILLIPITLFFNMGGFQNNKSRHFVRDNYRFEIWQMVVNDVNDPNVIKGKKLKFPLTGFGMGTFRYMFHLKHKNRFLHAHNEYIELLYDTGYIGLIIFLCGIGYIIKTNFSFSDRYRAHLLSSFVCVAVCAGGLFVWQLGAHAYYTIVIAGLLHNKGGIK